MTAPREENVEALTIHRCANCGHHEGETIQAGCCPRCGRSSEPVPIRVVEKRVYDAEVARLSGERDRQKQMADDYRTEVLDVTEKLLAAEDGRERLREAAEYVRDARELEDDAHLENALDKLCAALSAGTEQEGETRAHDRDTRDGACTCQKNGWNPDCPRHGRTQ